MMRGHVQKGMLAFAAVGLVAAGFAGSRVYREWSTRDIQEAAARKEAKLQGAEIEVCRKRLKQFHASWERYRREHKGEEPPTLVALLPRYIKDAKQLSCPTAERWLKERRGVSSGEVTYKKRKYLVTYGFQWLTAGYPIRVKRGREQTPLVTCSVHEEVLYRAAYGKAPALGVLDDGKRKELVPTVAKAAVLVVRRNGEVSAQDPKQN